MYEYILILVDYILISKGNFKEEDVKFNPDEVSDVELVSLERLREQVQNDKIKITPWFSLIVNSKIENIWKCLGDLRSIKENESKVGISVML
jgi:isopentenyldiphosphate isomerase